MPSKAAAKQVEPVGLKSAKGFEKSKFEFDGFGLSLDVDVGELDYYLTSPSDDHVLGGRGSNEKSFEFEPENENMLGAL